MVRPRVYFEEWDEPMIAGIPWISEIIQMAGGDDIFAGFGRRNSPCGACLASARSPARFLTFPLDGVVSLTVLTSLSNFHVCRSW